MTVLALALDGSTHAGSVALLRDGVLSAEAQVAATDGTGPGRGEALVPLIAEMLESNGARASEISLLICGAGPGSFTSLRVAASVAKGIAFAAGARMHAVSSLLLTVAGMVEPPDDGEYVAALPAMRGELFALPVRVVGGVPTGASERYSIVDQKSFVVTENGKRRIIGPGQEIDASPHARGAARLYRSIASSAPIDLNAWEPDYGRLAEAQVKWEAAHGRPLGA